MIVHHFSALLYIFAFNEVSFSHLNNCHLLPIEVSQYRNRRSLVPAGVTEPTYIKNGFPLYRHRHWNSAVQKQPPPCTEAAACKIVGALLPGETLFCDWTNRLTKIAAVVGFTHIIKTREGGEEAYRMTRISE